MFCLRACFLTFPRWPAFHCVGRETAFLKGLDSLHSPRTLLNTSRTPFSHCGHTVQLQLGCAKRLSGRNCHAQNHVPQSAEACSSRPENFPGNPTFRARNLPSEKKSQCTKTRNVEGNLATVASLASVRAVHVSDLTRRQRV